MCTVSSRMKYNVSLNIYTDGLLRALHLSCTVSVRMGDTVCDVPIDKRKLVQLRAYFSRVMSHARLQVNNEYISFDVKVPSSITWSSDGSEFSFSRQSERCRGRRSTGLSSLMSTTIGSRTLEAKLHCEWSRKTWWGAQRTIHLLDPVILCCMKLAVRGPQYFPTGSNNFF